MDMKKRANIDEDDISFTFKFRKEFKTQLITGITAAFAFLLALSWREPIADSVNLLIEKFNLAQNIILFKFISAIVITIIAVLILIFISKWGSRK